MKVKYVVFDLDDTLTYEIDFLKSAYKEIASKLDDGEYDIMINKYFENENVFDYISDKYGNEKQEFISAYRGHFPKIKLVEGARDILDFCKENNYHLGLLTDGRSITQRNKIKSLDIERYFDKIVISEEIGSTKPNERNYSFFLDTDAEYYYIADNPKKDFLTPNRLGWITVCILDRGNNIHKQDFHQEFEFLPRFCLKEIKDLIHLF